MRVVRLEAFGFKSFMERLVLNLEHGLTGVVGPNGCGKSNVVDALRWVMGETRASQLRGDTLEDVIFNGTDTLRPLGLAEVTLTLRPEPGDFEDEEGDVEVLDVLLNDDSPEARRAKMYVIENTNQEKTLEQEMLEAASSDEVVAEVPQETTTAVITEETPSDNSSAVNLPPVGLARFSWIQNATEIQVTRRLYRSGESEFFINRVPCRLKDLKEFFRAVGLGAKAHTIIAQGEVGRIVSAKPEERRLILEEAAGTLGFRDKIAEANRRLTETKDNISRINDIADELSRQVGTLKRQATRALNRRELREELSTLEREVFLDAVTKDEISSKKIQEEYAQVTTDLAEKEALLVQEEKTETEKRAELLGSEGGIDDARREVQRIQQDLLSKERFRAEKRSRLQEANSAVLARETDVKRLVERKTTLEARREITRKEVSELETQDQAVAIQLQQIDTSIEEELRNCSATVGNIRQELRQKEQGHREMRDKLVAARSTLASVSEQIVAASPLTQLQKSLGSEAIAQVQQGQEKIELFASGLVVPDQYARVVQAFLAERAKFLVSEEPHQIAKSFLVALSKKNEKERKGIGIGVLRKGDTTSPDKSWYAQVPFRPLLSLMEVRPGFELAAEAIFHGVLLADSSEEAFSFFADPTAEHKAIRQDATLVTAEGDIVSYASFFSLRHEGGLIQLTTRERQLRAEVDELNAQHEAQQKEREDLQVTLQHEERRHSDLLRESQRQQNLLRELGRSQGAIRGRLQAEKRLLDQIEQDILRAGEQAKEAESRIAEFAQRATELRAEVEALDTESDAKEKEELQTLLQNVRAMEETRNRNRQVIQELQRQVQMTRRAVDALRARSQQLELEKKKRELEFSALLDRMTTEYGDEEVNRLCGLERPTELFADHVARAKSQRVHEIRNRIAREGEVDPTSVERYEEENTRLEALIAQKQDLDNARHGIQGSINQLVKTSETKFMATFEAVRVRFGQLVEQLFGGGKGDLELVDPAKPLETGVEIVARPPGKKLKSIDLMSGGEKALCATALIFAMFTERPSPLCVLDEVDAPLDEANLGRFLVLVKEMSQKTQFIMITHNKASMSAVDKLVGVTMQQPGASKMIAVSLQEAIHVAA